MALRDILKKQYNYAKSQGWLPHFANAAAKYGFATADLVAIASRESNMRNIIGDFGNGYSLMQLDRRSYPEFCKSGQWKDPEAAIFKGAECLASKRDAILKAMSKPTVTATFSGGRSATFKPRAFTNATLRHMFLAGYNCDWDAAYYHYSKGNDIDRGTTGKDYGRDVMDRAAIFQTLLEKDNVTPTPKPSEPSHDSLTLDDVAGKVSVASAKQIALRAAVSAKAPIFGLWQLGFTGKVLLILAALIIMGVLVFVGVKYWPRIKSFVIRKVKGQ